MTALAVFVYVIVVISIIVEIIGIGIQERKERGPQRLAIRSQHGAACRRGGNIPPHPPPIPVLSK